jgi:hypothetical protein
VLLSFFCYKLCTNPSSAINYASLKSYFPILRKGFFSFLSFFKFIYVFFLFIYVCLIADMNLTKLAGVKVDANVSFDWGTGAPSGVGNGFPVDSFSVRWHGSLKAIYTGTNKNLFNLSILLFITLT